MTKRTRYFLIVSSLVVVGVLCTGLVAYYSGALPSRLMGASATGPEDLAYLPQDATAVAYANVRAVMDSEFRQRLRQVMPTGQDKDQLQQATGIDVERDIDSVVAGFSGADPTEGGAVALVRGRFNEGQIEALARAHGAAVEEYKGKRLITHADLPKTIDARRVEGTAGSVQITKSTGCIAFLEPGLLAMGDSAAIKRAIDARGSGQNVTTNAELMGFVKDVSNGNTAWAVGRFDEVMQNKNIPENVKAQIPPVQWFAVSAHIDGGVSGVIRAEARDDQAGENLRDVVRGGLAAARMMGGQDTRVETMLQSVQLTGTGKTVSLAFRVPPELLDLINGIGALRNLSK